MSNDKCQCGCEPSAEPRPYGFAEALRRHHQAAAVDPVIWVEFTVAEAAILWPLIQERAEQLAEELEQIREEHHTTQELADILYHQLERIGGHCGE